MNETEKNLGDEKPAVEEVADGNKDNPANDTEEKEPEDKVISNPNLCFYLPYWSAFCKCVTFHVYLFL